MANHNVGFKMGLQSAVDTLIQNKTGATPGSFYLTSDTHRLYIGADDGSLQSVNEGVETVQSVINLPSINANNASVYAGRFFYAIKENILCVFSGREWIQLNPDTAVTAVEFVAFELDDNQIRINNRICNQVSGSSSVTYIESNSVDIIGANGINVEISDEVINDVVCHKITIKDAEYKVSAAKDGDNAVIKLDSDQANKHSTVTLVPELYNEDDVQSNIAFTVDSTTGEIKIAAKDTHNASMTVAEGYGFEVAIVDSENDRVSAVIDPKIQYGSKGELAQFVDGVATLDVYSKSDIAETLKALNAMTYRGTAGSGGSAASRVAYNPATGITTIKYGQDDVICSVGDTFLVCGDNVNVNGGDDLTPGSLIIAKGQEDDEGLIIPSTLEFDAVESTADTDTLYYFTGEDVSNGGGITLNANSGSTRQQGTIIIQGDTSANIIIEKGATSSVGNGIKETLTIKHASVERKDDTSATILTMENFTVNGINSFGREITVPVVVGVETDSNGHITKVKTRNYNFQDTPGVLTSVSYETSSYEKGDKSVGVLTSYTGISNPSTRAEQLTTKHLAFSSSSLKITDNDTAAISDTSSTTASGLQIELVWGSFS